MREQCAESVLNENLLSIAEACDRLPGRKNKRLSFTTVWRWILKGTIGPDGQRVRLEAVRLGGKYVTSQEAIARFSAKLTPSEDAATAQPIRSPTERQRANATVSKRLERLGI